MAVTIYLQCPGCEVDIGVETPGDDGAYNVSVRLERARRDAMELTRAVSRCEQPFPALNKSPTNMRGNINEGSLRLVPHDGHAWPDESQEIAPHGAFKTSSP